MEAGVRVSKHELVPMGRLKQTGEARRRLSEKGEMRGRRHNDTCKMLMAPQGKGKLPMIMHFAQIGVMILVMGVPMTE